MHGIDNQIGKAERAVAGMEPVKRNRFVKLTGGDRAVNQELEAKARSVAGLKACITNMVDLSPDFVIGPYHQLWLFGVAGLRLWGRRHLLGSAG